MFIVYRPFQSRGECNYISHHESYDAALVKCINRNLFVTSRTRRNEIRDVLETFSRLSVAQSESTSGLEAILDELLQLEHIDLWNVQQV